MSTKSGGEPVWDFGRTVLILGGPFLGGGGVGGCSEADIQTRLKEAGRDGPDS